MKTIKKIALLAAMALLYGCGGDSVGDAPIGYATFKSNGGSASFTNATSYGGRGGGIDIEAYGDVKVSMGGGVDTGFTVPTYDANYGSVKATVFSNTSTTVLVDPIEGAAIGSGRLFARAGNSNLYVTKSATFKNNSTAYVTGLEVQANAKLKLPANNYATAYYEFYKRVTINGTVKPLEETSGLALNSQSLLEIGTTGLVTTKPATPGFNGGDIQLFGAVVINKGTIDSTGSAGSTVAPPPPPEPVPGKQVALVSTDGGAGGGIDIDAMDFLYNTGSILAKGGSSTLAAGGRGRHIHLFAHLGSLYSSGTIDNSGGNGKTEGGRGGWNIRLYSGYMDGGYNGSGPEFSSNGYGDGAISSVVVSGSLISNGGTGGSGNGGDGGYDIYLESAGGKCWSSATVSAKGGASTQASGGHGGDYDLYADYGTGILTGNYVETAGIKLTGNIDLSGGAGSTSGGDGGTLYLENDYSDAGLLPAPVIQLYGYASFTMDGGAGIEAGDGGGYGILTDTYWFGGDYDQAPFGSILNEVPVSAKGGAGSMTASKGRGGYGGGVYFDWNDYDDYYDGVYQNITTTNKGALDLSGGAGYTGGDGGGVFMYGYGKLLNTAPITTKGGAGVVAGGDGSGGDMRAKTAAQPGPMKGGGVTLISSYNAENSGAIDTSGGTGENGGCGGMIGVYAGGQVINVRSLSSIGGNGSVSGGDGGYIALISTTLPTANSGALKVTKGTGGTKAQDGYISIDTVDVGPVHTD